MWKKSNTGSSFRTIFFLILVLQITSRQRNIIQIRSGFNLEEIFMWKNSLPIIIFAYFFLIETPNNF